MNTKYRDELQKLKPHDEVQYTDVDKTTGLLFIGTAGHGYLVVPKTHKDAEKARSIVKYGFVGALAYYLEEDCEYFEFLKAIGAVAVAQTCPACKVNELNPEQVMNSLSRYRSEYICNPCGMREAFEGDFWGANKARV